MAATDSILVFGAAGAQGKSVVSALVAGPHKSQASIFGVTRDASKPAPTSAATWAGWRVADADKPETLPAAFEGITKVFVVTNYWEHLDGAREERQGKAIMDAAVTAGVRQIVFSGLPSPQELHGIKGVHHLEHKAVLEKYLLSDACAAVPFRTVARIAYYYQNQLSFFPPRKGEDGSYTISVPMGDKPLKAVDVNDYGQLVAAVFAQPEKYAGKTVNAVGDYQPVSHICEEISKAVGVKVSYYPVEVETFASWGFPGAEDLANMFAFNQKDPWNAQAGVEDDALREEYPAAKTWAQWVQQPEVVAQLRKAMGL